MRPRGASPARNLPLGGDRPGINPVGARLSQGIPAFGATGDNNPRPGRPNERVDFTKVSPDLSRTQVLFQPWDRATVALPLRPAEQRRHAAAGRNVLPGRHGAEPRLYAGQVSGGDALGGTVEVRLDTGFGVRAFGRSFDVNARLYAFYDRGQSWENRREEPNLRPSSRGSGARLFLTRCTRFDVEGVIRDTRLPRGTRDDVRPLKAEAVFWRVLTRF